MTPYFDYYQDHAKEWRWRLQDESDKTVADSAEGYKDKADCKKGAELFTSLGVDAPEREGKSGGGPAYEYFLDSQSAYRWHFQAANNEIIADSGSRTFPGKSQVQQAIAKVRLILKGLGGGKGSYVPPAASGSSGSTRFA